MKLKHINKCYLTIGEKWCNSFLVTYPVSYTYNGGTIIDNDWYNGYSVAKPKVPKGYKLTSISCGLQLNCYPPFATSLLESLDGKPKSISEIKSALATIK